MKTKICTKCGIEKSLDEFSPRKNRKNKKSSWCKICQKKHRDKHKEKRKIYFKKYKLKNKEKIKIQDKKYREEHKEEAKQYYLKNKEKLAIKNKKYNDKYKEKINKNKQKYEKNRRKTNIRFKITCNLRGRIYKAIRGESKSLSTMMLIGCETDYLLYHLQSQFKTGMSWDNYGKWHIDHIRPCASFDLSKPEEQTKCFHYSNLQPLWKKDNLIKRDKWNNNLSKENNASH